MIKKILLSVVFLAGLSGEAFAEIKKGDTLQLLSNLHADGTRRLVYAINYQLPTLMPVCTEVKVVAVKKKKMVFTWAGVEYTIKYDGHTRKAGISFDKVLSTYFGRSCDTVKLERLNAKDKEGVRYGRAMKGMTRDGILLAMGRPPFHANPDLDASSWMYWMNKFNRTVIEFDESGRVSAVRD